MSKSLNDNIKTHILAPDNCNCTLRELQGEHSAVARDITTHANVGYIYWNAREDHYNVRIIMTIGNKFEDKIYHTDSSKTMDSKIEALFALMNKAWTN